MSWAKHADKVLATLFKFGQPAPTKQELFDAYPFGMRQYHPYKLWLKRVQAWKAAHAKGLAAPPAPVTDYSKSIVASRLRRKRDTETGDLEL